MKNEESFIFKIKFQDEAGYYTVIKEFYTINELHSFIDKEWRLFKGRCVKIIQVPDPIN